MSEADLQAEVDALRARVRVLTEEVERLNVEVIDSTRAALYFKSCLQERVRAAMRPQELTATQ